MLVWTARLAAVAVVLLLVLMASEGHGGGPAGWREWGYLALFPVGFSLCYLAALRWSRAGAMGAIACMIGSQLVIGRTFDATAYVIWALLCLPAVLLLLFHRPGEKPGRSASEGDHSGDT